MGAGAGLSSARQEGNGGHMASSEPLWHPRPQMHRSPSWDRAPWGLRQPTPPWDTGAFLPSPCSPGTSAADQGDIRRGAPPFSQQRVLQGTDGPCHPRRPCPGCSPTSQILLFRLKKKQDRPAGRWTLCSQPVPSSTTAAPSDLRHGPSRPHQARAAQAYRPQGQGWGAGPLARGTPASQEVLVESD